MNEFINILHNILIIYFSVSSELSSCVDVFLQFFSCVLSRSLWTTGGHFA